MPTFDDYTTQHGAELSAALTAFEQQETPKGFINSHENGMALIKHLADNDMPATLASLELSARMHVEKGYKFYLTPQELSLQFYRCAACCVRRMVGQAKASRAFAPSRDCDPYADGRKSFLQRSF